MTGHSGEPMAIFIADVPFDEDNRFKRRPALVLQIEHERVLVFKITSKFKNKSKSVQQFYFPITAWQQAGLLRQSYVDIHQVYSLPAKEVFKKSPIGRLAASDILALQGFVQKYRNKTRLV